MFLFEIWRHLLIRLTEKRIRLTVPIVRLQKRIIHKNPSKGDLRNITIIYIFLITLKLDVMNMEEKLMERFQIEELEQRLEMKVTATAKGTYTQKDGAGAEVSLSWIF